MVNKTNSIQITFAIYVIFALPVAIALSPPLSNLLELTLYVLFIVTPDLRSRFISSFQKPFVVWGFLFCFMIILSSLWSQASWDVKLEHIASWRKIFLLPMAVSLINSNDLKNKFLLTFVTSISFFALLSWLSHFSVLELPKPPNSLLRNHVTQGMVFFVASFVAVWLLFLERDIGKKHKILLAAVLIILLSNSFFITTSRSAYAIGLVLAVCPSIFIRGKKAILLSAISVTVVAFSLYFSPTSNTQIQKTLEEASSTSVSLNITSGGARIVFWKNTLQIIKSASVIGHGLKAFPLEYAKQVRGVSGWKGTITGDPHNQYFLILSEQGIIGLTLFFIFIISCFFQKLESFYMLLGGSVLLGWMVTSLFNGHFSASIEGKFILLWCGAMLSSLDQQKVNSALAK